MIAAYRYHRIRATDTAWNAQWGGYNVAFCEVKFYTGLNQVGTEFANLGTAFATDYAAAGNEPNKANDNNNSTYWVGTTTATLKHWGVDSGSGNSYTIMSFSILPYIELIPRRFVLEGSNDNSTWVDIPYMLIPTQVASWYHYNVIIPINNTQIIPAMTIY